MESSSVLVPAAYDVVWTLVAGLAAVMTVVALVVWVRRHGSGLAAVGELALIVLLPVLGPLAYLLGTWRQPEAGRRAS